MAKHADPDMRYRFDVVGRSVIDVISAAGGWLYDRAAAGWDVTVLILDAEDIRPVQILGARALDLASALAQWERWPHPQTIAVSAEMIAAHALVRQGVREALEHGRTEVTLWGTVPPELDADVAVRQHRLSAAARAFKAQALLVASNGRADSAIPVADTEVFRCGLAASPSVAADLSPAS